MKYSSENHNWDLTVMASSKLMDIGRVVKEAKSRHSFSCFTGAMLLAVAGLESFLNSMAFFIKDADFCYNCFEKKSIQEKLDFFLTKYNINLNKGFRPYQTIKEAITWRNSVSHSKPTFVAEIEIEETSEVRKIPKKHASSIKYEPYENLVDLENADRFNRDIIEVIQLIINKSGIKPQSQCTYSM